MNTVMTRWIWLLLACACAAHGATNRWTTNGPYGGVVTLFLVDPKTPTTLYAAGPGAMFKSTDGGANWAAAGSTNWQPPTAGAAGFPLQAMAIDPVTPTTLYADSVQVGRLVKSTDGAATWTAVGPTLVVSLAVDPKTPSTIYAGQQQGGIYKSTDGGVTWANTGVLTLPVFPTFKVLVVDPQTPSTLYAGETTQGIFKSVDGGATWAPANTGFGGPIIGITGLAIDRETPSTLYAVASASGGSGLFKSSDGGGHWARILAPAAANNFFIGPTVALDPLAPATLYVGTGSGVFRSTDGGASFAPVRTGLPSAYINVLAVDPHSVGHVFAATTNGVYATTDAGATWAGVNNGIALTSVTALAMDALTPTTLYSGTSTAGLFKSVDGGGSWTAINAGLAGTGNGGVGVPAFTAIAVDPVTPANVYASGQSTEHGMVIKSTNGGASWSIASAGIPSYQSVYAIAIDPANPKNIVIGTANLGALRSVDAGATWNAPVAGIPASSSVIGLAWGTTSPRSLWAAVKTPTGDVLMNSPDGGATWSSTYPGFDIAKGLAWFSDFLFNTIGIRNFTLSPNPAFLPVINLPASQPLPTLVGVDPTNCLPVTALLADPASATGSYVAAGCGVGKGTDNSMVITAMNAGLPPAPQVNALTITPAGDRLYAGAANGGVYAFSTGAKVGVVTEFYNTLLDNYFITANPVEAAAIDNGSAGPGWVRTGAGFNFNSGGDTYVCRFYGSIAPGPNSHFYTAGSSECAGLKALQASTPATQPRWNFESLDFVTTLPVDGACPAGTVPVYRAYNNGFNRHVDSNHRITPSAAGIAAVVARGWVSEGVVMCAPA